MFNRLDGLISRRSNGFPTHGTEPKVHGCDVGFVGRFIERNFPFQGEVERESVRSEEASKEGSRPSEGNSGEGSEEQVRYGFEGQAQETPECESSSTSSNRAHDVQSRAGASCGSLGVDD